MEFMVEEMLMRVDGVSFRTNIAKPWPALLLVLEVAYVQ